MFLLFGCYYHSSLVFVFEVTMERVKHLLKQMYPAYNKNHTLTSIDARDTISYPAIPLSTIYPSAAKELRQTYQYDESLASLEKYGRDISSAKRISPPNAVIFPQNKQEIVNIVKFCNSHKPNPIAIVPYSAGTGLESHTTSLPNRVSISLSFKNMDKLLSVYADDMQCTVQPGIGFMKLNKLLSPYKLFLGVDPAPSACIGGMVSTCCSGPSAVRYGTMRNQVINLTIVLCDGTIIKTGQRAIKSVAGYDLNGLFIGSEGTFGIIVEATLRLRPVYKYIEIAQAIFDNDDWYGIGQCVKEINSSGVNLAAFEFLDSNMVNDCKKYDPKANLIENKNVIMFKFTAPTKQHIDADISVIKSIVKKYSEYPFVWSKNEKERHRLWNVRKNCFWANKFAHKGLNDISTDVGVPFSKFSECIRTCKIEMDKSILYCAIVGHIGDSNWHAAILYDAKDPNQVKEAFRLNEFIVNTALKLEGTCTCEHGVGKNKRKFLPQELGHDTVNFMKRLKKHIDPNNIFCPGNVVNV